MFKPSLIALLTCSPSSRPRPFVARRAGRAAAGPDRRAAKTSGRATIKGVDYYYEVRGQGEPLLLLHGGLGSIDMFEPLLPAFTQSRQVIGVDLQGHGRTSLGNRPIRCEAIADDVAALLKRIGRAKVDVLGLFVRRLRRAAAGGAAPGGGAAAGAGVGAVRGRRLVRGDARAAGPGVGGACCR